MKTPEQPLQDTYDIPMNKDRDDPHFPYPYLDNYRHSPAYKYGEDRILDELKRYVDSTYSEHYAKNKYQATEFILDSGHGEGFAIGNVLKYAQRYGRKGTKEDARKDLFKVIHYAMIAIYNHDTVYGKNSDGN